VHTICLRVERITKKFLLRRGTLDVLREISYVFQSGRTYAITGASGAGKSTFLHILAGLTKPTTGTLYINEQNMLLFSSSEHERYVNKTIGLLFQMPYLIKELTVLENIMTKGLIVGVEEKLCADEALALLEKVGLSDKAYEYPSTLSGGQQQRVALARALFGKPAFLFADEPTGNLDTHTGKVIIDLLLACRQSWGMGIIVSTHDQAVAQRMDVRLEMQDGAFKS
jgi:ABC-type lipoprotein export system ATPase subunit